MTCNDTLPLLSPLLDGELAPADAATLRAHIAGCSECRAALDELEELHGMLKGQLTVPHADRLLSQVDAQIDRLTTQSPTTSPGVAPAYATATASRPASAPLPPRPRNWGVVLLAASLLVAALMLLQRPEPPTPAAPHQVASVAYAVGEVEMQPPGAPQWSPIRKGERTALVEGCRLRTPRDGLCEVQTSCEGTLRLNQETEVVVHLLERVELVRGELWAQAARQCELDIQLPRPASVERRPISLFTCPSSSELQWKVQDTVASCMATNDPVAVKPQNAAAPVSIGKGQAMAMVEGQPEEVAYHGDALAATSWQMPLLAQKPPEDSELQSRLDAMLAVIGETKVSYLYAEQIEELGPAGTIPLLAYVRSPASQAHPQRRQRAMQLVQKMASADQLDAVRALLSDSDPVVRNSAAATIRRLSSQKAAL